MNFYYLPTHADVSVNLYLYSFYGRSTFSVTLYKHDEDKLPVEWPYPQSLLSGDENLNSIV